MKMDMVFNSRSGCPPDIRPEIEPMGLINLRQCFCTLRPRKHDLEVFIRVKILNSGHVSIWDNHSVSAIIRKEIHDNITALASPNHQILFVTFFGGNAAKKTFIGFLFLLFERFNIGGTPRRKESLHYVLLLTVEGA